MAVDKSIDLLVRISAIFQGVGAFKALHSQIGSLPQKINAINSSFLKMAGAIGVVALGFKGIESASQFMSGAIAEAKENQAVEEKLGMALQRHAKLAKMGSAVIADQQEKLIGLAEQMERAGGIAASTLKAGFAGLTGAGFGPAQIKASAEGFQGLVVAMKGVSASAEDIADVTMKVRSAINLGLVKPFAQAGMMTKEQVKAFGKLTTRGERAAAILKLIEKQSGRTALAMKTDAGRIFQSQLVWKRIQETIGTPFLESQVAWSEAIGNVGKALEPVAVSIATMITPKLKELSKYISDSGPMIAEWGKQVEAAFKWLLDNGDAIGKTLLAIGSGFAAFAVINTLINPITWVVIGLAALSAAVIWLIQNWDNLGPATEAAWNTVVGVFADVGTWINSTLVKPIADATKDIWQPLVEPLTRLWVEIEPYVGEVVNYVVDAFKSIPKEIGDIWAGVTTLWNNTFTNWQSTYGPALEKAFAAWKDIATWVSTNVIAPVVTVFADLIHAIKVGNINEVFQQWGDNISSWITTNVIDPIVKLFSQVAGQVGSALGGVTAAIVAPFKSAYDQIMAFFSSIGTAITNALGALAGLSGAQANLHTEVNSGAKAAAAAAASGAPRGKTIGRQYGGLVSSPSVTMLAEKGIPEMVIPMQGGSRSRSLLGAAAEGIGMGGMMRGGSGPMNVSMSVPITVNGAAGGQEGAIGREIERAMQDPIKQLLEQLRRARAEERRTAYV